MKFLKEFNDSDLRVLAAIYIVGGILLCFFNTDIIIIGTRIIGGALTLLGIYFLYYFFGRRTSANASPFFIGLPCILMGLFMLIKPTTLVAILPILIGILFIISSLLSLQKAFMLRDLGITTWKISLGGDIIILIFGIILLLNPIRTLSFILQLVGLFLILDGIFLFWNDFLFHKYNK